MTDPIQTGTPQQQGQQGHTDGVVQGADILAAIPLATPEEDPLDYGDMLEKKYKFDPIPETIEEITPVVQAPVQAPAPVQTPVPTVQPVAVQAPVAQAVRPTVPVATVVQTPAPVQVQVPVPVPQVAPIPVPPVQAVPEARVFVPTIVDPEPEEIMGTTKFQTDVQKKFGELLVTTKKIYEFKDKMGISEETFDILGANNDKIFISYRFLLDETSEPILFITKIEQDKETEEETVNELRFSFNEDTSSLEVVINDILLFDEVQDFGEDQKKKLQVIDKINKFSFLASEELRKIEKEIKEKEEAEKERRKLQEIFRNF